MNQEEALNLIKRCNELCDQREELTKQRDDLLVACEFGRRNTNTLIKIYNALQASTVRIIRDKDVIEAAIASVQKAEEI